MKAVALILARGGSKGIPKKNIATVKGKPLISYSIEAALSSMASEVWVSTDCPEIKKVALNAGALVIDRPTALASDVAGSDGSLLHFAKNKEFDILTFIQPTSPLIKAKYINENLNLVISKNYDSAFSAYLRHWDAVWTKDIKPLNWDIRSRPRRQDVDGVWVENGMIYSTTRQALISSGLRYSGKIGVSEVPAQDSIEIDEPQDLKIFEAYLDIFSRQR
jgi:N-acylneuraminate cytidylyltransferase|tara:strand:+ start:2428 stop:3087 length:660 start_codon:yes stop_codon:yes gene_type:complete